MIDITFKNRTGLKPDILSAVIGADSFFYGFFTSDHRLIECKTYEIKSFNDDDLMVKIKEDMNDILPTYEGFKIKVSCTNKPYLHSSLDYAGKLTKYYPAFGNKEVFSDQLTDQDVVVDYGFTKSQSKFLSYLPFYIIYILTKLC